MTSNYKFSALKKVWVSAAAIFILCTYAAGQQQGAPPIDVQPEASPYSDPLFWILAIVALVLLVFINQLSKLFAAVITKLARKDNGKTLMILFLVSLASLVSGSIFAAGDPLAKAEQVPFLHHGFGNKPLNILALIIVLEVFVVLYYSFLIKKFLVKEKEAQPYIEKISTPFWDRFNKSVAVEQEAAILTDHDYDGIKELDNSLPPWWKYGFYLTIVWAVVYMAHFHVFGTGVLQLQELKNAEDQAAIDLAEYEKMQSNRVDELSVVFLSAAEDIAKGRSLFKEKTCTVCHGELGQGINGPNLTDHFWIHGGSINEIFKTIKYGVPEKGMKAWKSEISAPHMAQIASYIMSLKDSNPPGAKETQGLLYTPQPAVSDSSEVVAADSLQLNINAPDTSMKQN